MSVDPRTNEFNRQIKEHEKIIYKVCSFYTDNSEDLKDLFQEIVLQAWTAFPRFRGDSLFSTWLYRIALNTAVSFFRNEKKRGSLSHYELKTGLFDTSPGRDKEISVLHEIIAGLGKLEKALILLYLEDRKYSEIAEIMGISESNVGTRLSRIKEKLRLRGNQKIEQLNR
jgi:RNA polymerase sigma factor (sigma-70 family)